MYLCAFSVNLKHYLLFFSKRRYLRSDGGLCGLQVRPKSNAIEDLSGQGGASKRWKKLTPGAASVGYDDDNEYVAVCQSLWIRREVNCCIDLRRSFSFSSIMIMRVVCLQLAATYNSRQQLSLCLFLNPDLGHHLLGLLLNTGHPPYLTELIQYHKPSRSTRSSASHLLSVP